MEKWGRETSLAAFHGDSRVGDDAGTWRGGACLFAIIKRGE